jgi:hypothetical protein
MNRIVLMKIDGLSVAGPLRRMLTSGVLTVAIALTTGTGSALAQIGTTGSFVGTVRDSSGAVLPGATVTVTNTGTGTPRSEVTDEAGRYLIPSLPPGQYRLEASLQGFRSEVHTDVALTVAKTQEVNFILAIGQMSESVTVNGGAPLVETSSSTVSTLVSGDTIRALPLNGRSFDSLIALSPGTVMFDQRTTNAFRGTTNQFSAGGTRPGSTKLMVDGAEYAGAGGVNTNVNTASGKLLGVEAIQEFAVVTNTADATYGKKSGGQVNIVTRSGTNQFRGSALEFLRNDVFDARSFFDAEKPPLRRNNYGFATGGPIVSNKTFFFGNFEQLKEHRGITDLQVVPTASARQGFFPDGHVVTVNPASVPILNLYPLPNGRDFGDGTAELRVTGLKSVDDTFVMGRVDHNLSAGDSLFARYLIQTGVVQDPSGGLGQFADLDPLRTQLFTSGYKKVISSRLLNQATFAFNVGRMYLDIVPINGFVPPPVLILVPGETNAGAIQVAQSGGGGGNNTNPFPNLGGGISVGAQERLVNRRVIEFSDQVSYTTGPHFILLGGEFQRIHSDEFQQTQKRGQLVFPSLDALLQGKPSVFSGPFPGSDAQRLWRQSYVAVYGQDDVRLKPTFTLNLGLRWELLTNPTEVNGRIGRWVPAGSQLDGVYPVAPIVVNSVFATNNSGNFAPRVGFAWDLFGTGRTSLRSGVGLFYTQIENEFRRNLGAAAPFTLSATINNPPFPNPGQALATASLGLIAPLAVEESPKIPTFANYTVRLEQQIGGSTVLALAYVASRGWHLVRSTNPQIPAPFVNADGRLQVPQQVVNPLVNRTATFFVWDGDSSYDSLQAEVDKRFSHGLQFKVAFTWAKATDEGVETNLALSGFADQALVATDHTFDRGPAAFDIRRRLVITWSYELPVPKREGVLGALVDGWQWSGSFQAQDGFPFSLFDGLQRSFASAGTARVDRPDLAAGRSPSNIIQGGPDQYFDPTAFVLQPAGVLGNTAQGFLTGPGLSTLDSSFVKTFHLTGRTNLQFRIEGFNLLNRANFALPDNTLFQAGGVRRGAAGRIRNTTTTGRELQLGFKLSF